MYPCRNHKRRVRFFTKEEAALGVVGFRGDNLLRGNSVIFDYTKKRFICYEIRKTKDRVLVDSTDYTEQIKDAVANEEKDIAFLQIIKQALVRGVTATVYLCGEGFEGSWFKQSTKALCLGRRVFMSKHLFACGAVYLCEMINMFPEMRLCLHKMLRSVRSGWSCITMEEICSVL